jgi:hypothetical protein
MSGDDGLSVASGLSERSLVLRPQASRAGPRPLLTRRAMNGRRSLASVHAVLGLIDVLHHGSQALFAAN